MFQQFFTVQDIQVEISVDHYGDVEVLVNGEYFYSHLPAKVGATIIRECRKVLMDWFWSSDQDRISCSPYTGDGYGDRRERVFKLCGFQKEGDLWVLRKPTPPPSPPISFIYVDIKGRRI